MSTTEKVGAEARSEPNQSEAAYVHCTPLASETSTGGGGRLAQEARRQSLLVSLEVSESEALEFLDEAADTHAWT